MGRQELLKKGGSIEARMTGIEYCKASKEDIYKELVKAEDKIRKLKHAMNSYYGMHENETRGNIKMLKARYLMEDSQ